MRDKKRHIAADSRARDGVLIARIIVMGSSVVTRGGLTTVCRGVCGAEGCHRD